MLMDQDIFPEDFSSHLEKLEEPKKEHSDRCIPFVSYLPRESDKIHYRIMELNKDSKESCLKQTDWYEDKIRNKITWENVCTRLKRPLPDVKTAMVKSGTKKRDDRLAFRKDRNIFYTKSLFTFGLRHTAIGECHIYETYKQPLLLFIPLYKMQRYTIGSIPFDPTSKASRNIPDDRCLTYVLKRNSKYVIREDTFYMMMTVQRSVFAVYKLRSQALFLSDFTDFVGSLNVISMHSLNLSGKQLRKIEQNFENNSRTRKNSSFIGSDGVFEDDSSQPAAKRFRSASGIHFGNPLLDMEMNLDEYISSNDEDKAEDNRNVSLASHLTSNGHDLTIETIEPMNTLNLSTGVTNENLNPLPVENGHDTENPSSDISINRPSCSYVINLEDSCDDLSAIQIEMVNHSTPQKYVDQNQQSSSNTVDRGTLVSLNNCSISTQTETGNENEADVSDRLPVENGHDTENPSSDISINRPSCSSVNNLEDSCDDLSAIQTEMVNHSTPQKYVDQNQQSSSNTVDRGTLFSLNNCSISTQTETGNDNETNVSVTSDHEELSSHPTIQSSSASTQPGSSRFTTSSNQNDSSIENELAPFEMKDKSGNKFLYLPISLNWNESVSGPFLLHPFVKNVNGNVWAYVPFKTKDDDSKFLQDHTKD